jgi:CheY-like chemotaxis protein
MNTPKAKLKCILLVDDDEFTNSLHRTIIEDVGISKNIEIAESAGAAIDLLECPRKEDCKAPDLIFLDLNMPGLSGWDFLDMYSNKKKNCQNKSLIIILSNSTNPYDRKKAEAYEQVGGFRSKPLTDLMIHEIMDHYFQA